MISCYFIATILSVVAASKPGQEYELSMHLRDENLASTEAGLKVRLYKDMGGEYCESPLMNSDHEELVRGHSYNFGPIPCAQKWRGNLHHIMLLQDGHGLGDEFCVQRIQIKQKHVGENGRQTVFSATRLMSEIESDRWVPFLWDGGMRGPPIRARPDADWNRVGNYEPQNGLKLRANPGTGTGAFPGKK